ncbi:hypothetical protein AURDEDRAFT_112564 [Auricularia subglabra TFB-10046 SS5]|nr:hypothetical protein AURDEDRAFT_112564 [Auricularia subglabra TFB-10046 SS5]
MVSLSLIYVSFASLMASAIASPALFSRSIPAIQNDLAQISNKTTQISSAAIFAAANPGTQVFALAVSNAVIALGTATQQGVSDVNSTPGPFTDAQCTQLLNAIVPLIPNTMSISFPNLVKAKGALLQWGFTLRVIQNLGIVKTNTHNFIGGIGAKCSAALAAQAATIQSQTDTVIQNTINSFP